MINEIEYNADRVRQEQETACRQNLEAAMQHLLKPSRIFPSSIYMAALIPRWLWLCNKIPIPCSPRRKPAWKDTIRSTTLRRGKNAGGIVSGRQATKLKIVLSIQTQSGRVRRGRSYAHLGQQVVVSGRRSQYPAGAKPMSRARV